MNGAAVQQLLCAHRLECQLDGLHDVRPVLGGDADRVLNLPGEAPADLLHARVHLRLAAVAAQRDEICVQSAHVVGSLREALAHGFRQQRDLLVALLVALGAVDDGQAVDVADRRRRGAGEGVGLAVHEQLEALPVLEARQQVGLQLRVRKHEQLAQPLALVVAQAADVAAQRPLLLPVLHVALQREAVLLHLRDQGKVVALQKALQPGALLLMDAAQQRIRPRVVQDQVVVVVKQHDSLPDVFKYAGLQAVQHAVRGIVKAAPVQQKGRQTVSADRIIQQIEYVLARQEQEDRIDGHDGQDSEYHVLVLRPVLTGYSAHLADEQNHNHRNQ